MNENLTKLVAMIIVGSVAKSLFGQPYAPATTVVTNAFDRASDLVETVKG